MSSIRVCLLLIFLRSWVSGPTIPERISFGRRDSPRDHCFRCQDCSFRQVAHVAWNIPFFRRSERAKLWSLWLVRSYRAQRALWGIAAPPDIFLVANFSVSLPISKLIAIVIQRRTLSSFSFSSSIIHVFFTLLASFRPERWHATLQSNGYSLDAHSYHKKQQSSSFPFRFIQYHRKASLISFILRSFSLFWCRWKSVFLGITKWFSSCLWTKRVLCMWHVTDSASYPTESMLPLCAKE